MKQKRHCGADESIYSAMFFLKHFIGKLILFILDQIQEELRLRCIDIGDQP